ncbi:FAA hydrolase family protein [Paenibacillus psychroresistens]|uniref:FAA hydrolase family protein n=1 Tax=Paenibacillus psychroresistens TaxID=1778678 RepID=A0A6B8RRJ3_9BACL|nr:fumarylacetoacetate hydrolase family protein [Paenibacillus psychroresistens]QGQ98332.1 FAA hydrolase family protein [Paenibacillus psychroresistens]
MKLATLKLDGLEKGVIVTDKGFVLLETVSTTGYQLGSTELFGLLQNDELDALNVWYQHGGRGLVEQMDTIPFEAAVYAAPYRFPRKIWGIGMNYWQKAEDLASSPPNMEPICFMKPDTTLIGPNEYIMLPAISNRVTAEAELGLVIGKVCKDVPESEAMSVVAGYVPTLDMTAQDIHAKNPRFLGRSKCFDTFFSFGPHLVTLDECLEMDALAIETVLNGDVIYSNAISNMIYKLPFIVSYFSDMMTLLPGDIIMTGTPGSSLIREGDMVACRIDGFETLQNPVMS